MLYFTSHTATIKIVHFNMTEEMLARASLRKLLLITISISQITGSFPFSFDSDAELSFRWFSWPSISHFIKLVGLLFCWGLMLIFRDEYLATLGGWAELDIIASFLISIVGYVADVLTGIMALKNYPHIVKFYSHLVNFGIDMQKEASQMGPQKEVEQEMERRRRWLEVKVKVTVFFSVMNFTILSSIGLFLGNLLGSESWILATIPLVAFCIAPINLLRKIPIFLVIGVLTWIWGGLRIVRNQFRNLATTGNPQKLGKVLDNWKRANDLIEEYNIRFQWALLFGIFSLLVSILCTFYELCSWIMVVGPITTIVTLPGTISNTLALRSLCAIASDVNHEGKLCVEALRDIGGCKWLQKDQALVRKVKLTHVTGALQPPEITPGQFFTLGKRLIPSVSYLPPITLDTKFFTFFDRCFTKLFNLSCFCPLLGFGNLCHLFIGTHSVSSKRQQ